ncbi:Glycosyl transferase family 2 [Hymenobacter gelipurpurascens]|uniref:Glycosyl transferase family 2 n=1 Tax=Hymenobacter gelipurpurascens TaxID=89968 RepID=A0A212TNE9_9BACT|nr:glycosyltransferase [Hymenobacter gelipurpurascens]SNC67376.1 Glycosyl transferase family 2 [Hymenobacter gelipurpurascens]
MQQVTVSVCTITYNHADYIAQTIESVLAQTGPGLVVEMVIGDDGSSDGTREIIAGYAARYPHQIKPLFHEKNLGANANTRACLLACTGEFIAALEGDDYWTDPTKLHRQVEALRAAPDCAMCFHDAAFVYEANSVDRDKENWKDSFAEQYPLILPATTEPEQPCVRFSQQDIVRLGHFMPTPSLLFRASSIPRPLPDWFLKVYAGDTTMQLLSTAHGPALYLPRRMAAYRKHAGGLSLTSRSSLKRNISTIWQTQHYLRIFDRSLAPYFESSLEQLYFERSLLHQGLGQQGKRLFYYGCALTVNRRVFFGHFKRLASRFLQR